MSPSTELATAFTRQRRSLMLTSVALAAYTATGISLEKLSLLGNTFTVANPGGVLVSIWLLWTYFLLRFLQHRNDLADRGPAEALEVALRDRMIRAAKKQMEPRFVRNYQGSEKYFNIKFWYEDVVPVPVGGGRWKIAFQGSMTFRSPTNSAGVTRIDGYAEEVSPTFADRVAARTSVIIGTRYFTEYELPLLVAAAPVVATILW